MEGGGGHRPSRGAGPHDVLASDWVWLPPRTSSICHKCGCLVPCAVGCHPRPQVLHFISSRNSGGSGGTPPLKPPSPSPGQPTNGTVTVTLDEPRTERDGKELGSPAAPSEPGLEPSHSPGHESPPHLRSSGRAANALLADAVVHGGDDGAHTAGLTYPPPHPPRRCPKGTGSPPRCPPSTS